MEGLGQHCSRETHGNTRVAGRKDYVRAVFGLLGRSARWSDVCAVILTGTAPGENMYPDFRDGDEYIG